MKKLFVIALATLSFSVFAADEIVTISNMRHHSFNFQATDPEFRQQVLNEVADCNQGYSSDPYRESAVLGLHCKSRVVKMITNAGYSMRHGCGIFIKQDKKL